jgi:hypothetical protein
MRVVIDAQVYGTRRNHNLDHLSDLSPSFVGFSFVLLIYHSVIEIWLEPSMGYCKIGNKLPFQTRYFKTGRRNVGEKNDCMDETPFILDTLRHTPSCDGISCTVGQKETPQEEGECASSYDSKMGDFTAEICSEIEIIRQHYNKDYNLGYFPVSKFQNEFNEHLIIPTVPIESNDENTRIGPFKVLPDPAMPQMKKMNLWGPVEV